jgi:hypothetical protein
MTDESSGAMAASGRIQSSSRAPEPLEGDLEITLELQRMDGQCVWSQPAKPAK